MNEPQIEPPRRPVLDGAGIPDERVYRQITIPEELWVRLQERADEHGLDVNTLGVVALGNWLAEGE